ncbi:MAG: prenyltransferase [Denitrovibrio sp.]|nr:MAG: prenyltransferase [Denitrovibrio sp.]
MGSFLDLFRIRISLMVGLSTFAGACLSSSNLQYSHLYIVLGALFLSAGVSALNQYQERVEDGLMKRTNNRPIPSGMISPKSALIVSSVLIIISICFIMLTGSLEALGLACATIVIYNFIYTPLKKKTPFALLAGSVTGAIPPMLGFTALGGSMSSPDILTVCAIMYIWQTPHFAMLAEKYSEDYIKAGFKTLSLIYGNSAALLFIIIWVSAFISSLFFVPVAGLYTLQTSAMIHTILAVLTTLMLLVFYKSSTKVFHILNLSMVLFFLLLVVDRIII